MFSQRYHYSKNNVYALWWVYTAALESRELELPTIFITMSNVNSFEFLDIYTINILLSF